MNSKLGSLSLIFILAMSLAAQTPRYIAVTIDDLPVVSLQRAITVQRRITKNILKHIRKAEVPAIGFVNERKLFQDGKRDEDQIDLLRMWLNGGLELGNHTYSHKSLHNIPIKEYEAEILRGEIITRQLLEKNGMKMRYFRHPYLNTGLNLQVKKDLDIFLRTHEYQIAPVSIDNSDWIFARAYDISIGKKDRKLKRKIGRAYVPYLEAKMHYWERQSVKLFGREIKQILLLHANSINADYFDDVARMLKKRGYNFITLEESLTDEAYKLPDTFTKRAGISWLHRWALEKGRENVLPNEPRVPPFVMKVAGLTSE